MQLFGSYTGPTIRVPPLAARPPFPPSFLAASRKSNFCKTAVLVSLSATPTAPDRQSSSKSSGITYSVVPQAVVTLDPHNCSQGVVAWLVKQQVGYEIILLDSKCFPVLDNDTTRSTDYWKSAQSLLLTQSVPKTQSQVVNLQSCPRPTVSAQVMNRSLALSWNRLSKSIPGLGCWRTTCSFRWPSSARVVQRSR